MPFIIHKLAKIAPYFKDSIAVIISSIKGLLKNSDDKIIRRIQELIMLDPYRLGGHKTPDSDQLNDIFKLDFFA